MTQPAHDMVLGLTAEIVCAHVSCNQVGIEALPALIRTVYGSLSRVGVASAAAPALVPAVPLKKSVFPDFIVCLEDGRRLKTLKRHLKTAYGLTPDAYRAKWGLFPTYPMVAPNYAKRRALLAKATGLGRKRAVAAAAVAAAGAVRAKR